MPRQGLATRSAIRLVASLLLVCPALAVGGPTKSISPFMSSSFERTIHGEEREVDLSKVRQGLGRAEAFFGVDALSTPQQRYLTSGLQWQGGAPTGSTLRASALRTEGDGAALGGGQTLMRAENRLDLGGRWYMPDLATEVAQVSNTADNGDVISGRAASVGLAQSLGVNELTLSYFQADAQFNALGSSVVAGDRGFGLQASRPMGSSWQLSHDLRLHEPSPLRSEAALAQTFLLSRKSNATDIGRPWQFRAELGAPVDTRAGGNTPLALELAARTVQWRDWRMNSSLGWYDASMDAPLDLPVDGSLWRLSASRGLRIAGLEAEVSPTFALGDSRYQPGGRAARAGLNLGLSQLSDRIDLSVNYLSAGWAPTPDVGDDLQMTVNFTQSTGAIMPGIRTMAETLRLPWQRRR
ncbi:hypothetical protein SSPSH_002233 [Salinisphaera shabanensis E1L3A]|uniref:Uncharacterized protein n=2 Tax=Salinisphaera shabanensis TaxID=180542 RepID=U2ELD1_9GAMM|nr:hypothetical protein SSPSH_002233 [Salinisphaera shabanensis E1L3A]